MPNREYDFEADGFIVLRKVFDENTLAAMRKLLTEIVKYAEIGLEDPFARYYLRHRADQGVLYDLFQRHPEIQALARNPDILEALTTVLGPDILLYENSMVYKPKGKKNGVPFHQDFISRPDEPLKFIAWMAIDPVTETGGALKIIPGTHKGGFLKWHRVKGETHHDRADVSHLDTDKAKFITLDPGDVLIFNQLVVHGSDEAHTESLRLVYRASYQSFDEIYVPRGAPIVVRGGHPSALQRRFSRPYEPPRKKNIARRIVNRIGRSLVDF
ncbi:phytanoyl-CoA dioxygenase family protein [Solimonas soli]|uniref:phytanoyl-CoA dioxygenase family protein n=1 Tax=Solimonas soli TaxID=413479 RepID=UPI000A0392D9|nr:phytanoyl-CoA dioxygenase family protein [Solimonas soli]